MTEIHKTEDLKTALIAAIMNAGGSIEATFEQLGEASITEKTGAVSIAVERTATGVRYFVTENGTVKMLRDIQRTLGEPGETPDGGR